MPMIGMSRPSRRHHRVQRRKDLLVGKIAGRAEEHEGVRLWSAHGLMSGHCPLAAQLFELFQQLERERDAREIDLEVALQPQRDARAAQRLAREAPFAVLALLHAEMPSSTSSTMRLLDGAHAAQVRTREHR
jgi:hypothetical protein